MLFSKDPFVTEDVEENEDISAFLKKGNKRKKADTSETKASAAKKGKK